jgi:16S rRNA (cytosine1402-N4)-methyltransferase
LPGTFHHLPVMKEEVVEFLAAGGDGTYVDATVGLGGHSERLLRSLGPKGRIIGIDRDEDALEKAAARLTDERMTLKRGNFAEMETLLAEEKVSEVDGILFDLGVSMMQLKDYARGFSFLSETRLDMRMDKSQKISAWDIVNRYPKREIEKILFEFGEERLAGKIAKTISEIRRKSPIDSCTQLAGIVEKVYRHRGKIHPATRTFQALRIAVNEETQQLRVGLDAALRLLRKGGRMCVISYHSLEDRIVKYFIASGSRAGSLKIITKKPVSPTVAEVRANPASRSAKLRAAERL